MKDFLNSLLGKASRHISSALLGALGAHGLSAGSAEELATSLVGLIASVALSHVLK